MIKSESGMPVIVLGVLTRILKLLKLQQNFGIVKVRVKFYKLAYNLTVFNLQNYIPALKLTFQKMHSCLMAMQWRMVSCY